MSSLPRKAVGEEGGAPPPPPGAESRLTSQHLDIDDNKKGSVLFRSMASNPWPFMLLLPIVMVAVDGSDYAEMAVDQAISLGGICNSEIFVISVVDLYPEQMAVAPALVEKMSAEVRDYLDNAQKKIEAANISCETIVHMGGKPHEFIVDEAKQKEIDLIVLGTHGRSGLKRVLLGSVAQNVIGHSPCPVLVVPDAV